MLKKILLLNLCIISLQISSYAYTDDTLNIIEQNTYGQSYEKDVLADRLNRLETDYFGMAQSGDLDDRISKLLHISRNNKMPSLVSPYGYENSKKTAMQIFLDNVGSLFDMGSVTGFTPSVTTYGYSPTEDIYRQQYLDFLNNPQGYCPYHNRYHNSPINRLNPSYPYGTYRPPMPHAGYTSNYPINRYYHPTFYSPPNVYTRAGVHIIND